MDERTSYRCTWQNFHVLSTLPLLPLGWFQFVWYDDEWARSPSQSCEFYFFFRPERLALWMSEWKVRWGLVKASSSWLITTIDLKTSHEWQEFFVLLNISCVWFDSHHHPAHSCANFIMSWWIFCCLVFVFMKWNYHTQKKKKVKWKVSRCFPTKVRDKIQIYDLVADIKPPTPSSGVSLLWHSCP